jgi:shikimate dehydrogenase
LDEISPAAQLIGAVNMIVNDNNRLFGENTDGKGFMESLREAGEDPIGKKVVILGAGGASRAISIEMALAGASQITIVNIPSDRALAYALVDTLTKHTGVEAKYVPWESEYIIPSETDILINATPIGLYPNIDEKPMMDYDSMHGDLFVQDVIPNPSFTPFLAEAEKRNIRWNSGMGMLINQAAINIKMWTGRNPDKAVMTEAYRTIIG